MTNKTVGIQIGHDEHTVKGISEQIIAIINACHNSGYGGKVAIQALQTFDKATSINHTNVTQCTVSGLDTGMKYGAS